MGWNRSKARSGIIQLHQRLSRSAATRLNKEFALPHYFLHHYPNHPRVNFGFNREFDLFEPLQIIRAVSPLTSSNYTTRSSRHSLVMDVCEDWNSESSVELARLKFSHKTVVGRFQYGATCSGHHWKLVIGLCSVLLSSAMSKIDQSLYEAVRIDGGGWWREFSTITIRGLKQEISILMTITIIAALSSFDIIYIATLGGPGRHTLVPGITIYNLAFTESQIGLASAFGVSLFFIVLIVILPLQIFMRQSENDQK